MMKYLRLILILFGSFYLVVNTSYAQELSPDAIYSIDWNTNGTQIAVGRHNGIVDIIDAATEDTIFAFQGVNLGPAVRVSWSSTDLLAVGGYENLVRVWNLTTQQQEFTTSPHDQIGIQVLEWSPDSQKLVSATAYGLQAIQVYNLTGQSILSLIASSVYDVSWNPSEDQILVASGADISLYDALTGEFLGFFEGSQGELQEAE